MKDVFIKKISAKRGTALKYIRKENENILIEEEDAASSVTIMLL